MTIKLKYALIIPGIILVSVLIYCFTPVSENPPDKTDALSYDNLQEVVFEVSVSEVIKSDLIKSINANGMARAYNELDIISNTSGYIRKVNIFEGKSVSGGDLLLNLDDREYLISLNEAEAKLNEAKIQYVIQKREIGQVDPEKGSLLRKELQDLETVKSKLNYDEYNLKKNDLESELILSGAEREKVIESRSGLTTAKNNYEKAALMLSYTRITAPFSGLIADFDLTEGKRVNSGEKLFRLVDISKIKIDVGVLENDVPAIRTSSKAEVIFNALSGEKYTGEVIYINPCIDPSTKTCRVTVKVENENKNIKPGMFATVKLNSETLKDRILIPREALVIRDGRNLIFVQEGNLAKWKYVETGEQNEKYIEVLKGAEPGEKVITEGNFNLVHDAKIKIKPLQHSEMVY